MCRASDALRLTFGIVVNESMARGSRIQGSCCNARWLARPDVGAARGTAEGRPLIALTDAQRLRAGALFAPIPDMDEHDSPGAAALTLDGAAVVYRLFDIGYAIELETVAKLLAPSAPARS